MNKGDTEGVVSLVLMRGLPRSGKSTIAKGYAKLAGCPIVSRDAIRLSLHGEAFIQEREEEVSRIAKQMLRALAMAGHDRIVIDECHVDWPKSVQEVQDVFSDTSFDLRIRPMHVATSWEVCVQRAIYTDQDNLIPVIEGMRDAWKD